jgi:hypothetical protein
VDDRSPVRSASRDDTVRFGATRLAFEGRLQDVDPTGLSSPFGQLVIIAGLIATIVVLIMLLRRRR